MSQRILLAIAVALGLLVIGLGLFWNPGQPETTVSPRGGDFTLQSADGPVSLSAFRGKVVLLYFGYTYCPDICPTSLVRTAAALNLLKPEEASRVVTLLVSVDPERDTLAHLKEYVTFFHPGMVGLTSSQAEVAAVAKQYGAFYAKHQTGSAAGYVVDHTADVYLIGTDGVLKERLPHVATPEQMVAAIRERLSVQ
ncbi:MAG: hypothetical protein H6R10_3431 [Rhodocyclaceae bacterium]|nr:hypothetical protein [Rhodocyclaceae bacterium]